MGKQIGRTVLVGGLLSLAGAAADVDPAVAVQGEAAVFTAPTGRIVENVRATSDSSRSFALYVPTSYTPDREWPLVMIMDPRGRGVPPLRKLVPAAERLGYVVASSSNTASDVGGDPNTPAVNAMLATLQPRLSLDDRRFYLFGMSGTARIAWSLAYAGIPHFAGVAGFGAGIPPDMDLGEAVEDHGAPFAFYGGAGDRDYNYGELVVLGNRLDRLGFDHTTVTYGGRHGWPPDEAEFEAALSWLHMAAMRQGRLEPDTGWLNAEYESRLAAARELEDDGRHGPAWRAYASLAADVNGLLERTEAGERAVALADDPEVSRWRARRLELARAHLEYEDRATAWLRATADAGDGLPGLDEAIEALAVDSLQALADGADDAEPDDPSAAAWRALSSLFSMTSFYFPRFAIDARDWDRARLMLWIANSIVPGAPPVCRQYERVARELGDVRSLAGCARP
ncbi:MAG: hypothetical protein ACODAA_01470 [Gemmatimonadota bacterium]